jgi:hypothetical protein
VVFAQFMAELGIAASVAGLISLAIQVTQTSYDYVKSVSGSTKSISEFAQEVSLLITVLGDVREALDSAQDQVRLARDLSGCVDDLVLQMRSLAIKLDKKSHATGLARFGELRWPFQEKETRQIIERFQRFRG